MLDGQGYVAEATVDNFFIVTERALLTPPTATNLKGVTRETAARAGGELGISADETGRSPCSTSGRRSEAFICGTGAEVVPVGSVDGRVIGNGASGRSHLANRRRVPRARPGRRHADSDGRA